MKKFVRHSTQLLTSITLKKNKAMYKIVGSYKGGSFEDLDTTESYELALELKKAYEVAFKVDSRVKQFNEDNWRVVIYKSED